MYKVIIEKGFKDLEDNNFIYKYNDIYPREGTEPNKKRIKELLSTNNKIGEILIEEIVESKEIEVPEDEKKETDNTVETEVPEDEKKETDNTVETEVPEDEKKETDNTVETEVPKDEKKETDKAVKKKISKDEKK